MAGAGGGGGPSSAPPPQGTRLSGVAVPPSHLSRPPQHQTKGEAPSPRGRSHPSLGCTFSGFQQSMAQGATGWGRGPVRLSGTAAVTRVCWSVRGPTVCAICFSEG